MKLSINIRSVSICFNIIILMMMKFPKKLADKKICCCFSSLLFFVYFIFFHFFIMLCVKRRKNRREYYFGIFKKCIWVVCFIWKAVAFGWCALFRKPHLGGVLYLESHTWVVWLGVHSIGGGIFCMGNDDIG